MRLDAKLTPPGGKALGAEKPELLAEYAGWLENRLEQVLGGR